MADEALVDLLALATQEHARSWRIEDAAFFEHASSCAQAGRPLNHELLRKFATTYNVSRGLRAGREAEYARTVRDIVHNRWSEDLSDRLSIAQEIIERAKKKNLTKGRQASLCSKTLWFLFPTRWFIYDRFVAAAIRLPERNDPSARMSEFQSRMYDLGAHGLVDDLREPLRLYDDQLHPERIIDKLLMFIGMSLFERRTPKGGPYNGAWNAPNDKSQAFAERIAHLFESSDLIIELRRMSLP